MKCCFPCDQPFVDENSFKQCCVPINEQTCLLLCHTTNVSFHDPNSIGRVSSEIASYKHLYRERRACLCGCVAYPCLLPWQICTQSMFLIPSSSSTSWSSASVGRGRVYIQWSFWRWMSWIVLITNLLF